MWVDAAASLPEISDIYWGFRKDMPPYGYLSVLNMDDFVDIFYEFMSFRASIIQIIALGPSKNRVFGHITY